MATEKEANKQEATAATPAASAPAEENKGTHKKATGKKAEGEESVDNDEPVYHEPVKREKKKSNWDLKKCQKVARRFDTIDAWREGAPSCYKSATANNWVAQCSSHMKTAQFVKKARVA